MSEPITIVGGGLAGLMLGIGLRQRGVAVTVWEAGRYPRHRVCGEFISGRGQASLARLGLLPGLHGLGARAASRAAFFHGSVRPARWALPEKALCLSRFILDEWLAGEFRRLGGELREGSRWTGEFGAGVVRASGRRVVSPADGSRWFGLKVHARGIDLHADLEMHFTPAGYVGLCRLSEGVVNLCGLFRSPAPVPDLAHRWREWLGGPPGSGLDSRLAAAQLVDGSLCFIAGLDLRPQHAAGRRECCIGDAITMIPPLTGNGMSMAFESAEMALDPLVSYGHGKTGWAETRTEIARRCDTGLTSRLRWAKWLQRALFFPPARFTLLWLASHSEAGWRNAFERTR